ncbi:hypothetical protein A5766_07705 [Gordonia sp. 852002-51296_SCH5728562-b]|nr:hypothetical protein A5766_07705 [Gordonia sp. 852002-51296_SCH5728562-b]
MVSTSSTSGWSRQARPAGGLDKLDQRRVRSTGDASSSTSGWSRQARPAGGLDKLDQRWVRSIGGWSRQARPAMVRSASGFGSTSGFSSTSDKCARPATGAFGQRVVSTSSTSDKCGARSIQPKG